MCCVYLGGVNNVCTNYTLFLFVSMKCSNFAAVNNVKLNN